MAKNISNSTALKQDGWTVHNPHSRITVAFETELTLSILFSQLRSERKSCSEILGIHLKTSEPNQGHKIPQLKCYLAHLFQIPNTFLNDTENVKL